MIAYSAIALFCDIISICTAPANSLHNQRIHELVKSISGRHRSLPDDQRKRHMTKTAARTRKWSIPWSTAIPIPGRKKTSDTKIHKIDQYSDKSSASTTAAHRLNDISRMHTDLPRRTCRRPTRARQPPPPRTGTAARPPPGRREPWQRRPSHSLRATATRSENEPHGREAASGR